MSEVSVSIKNPLLRHFRFILPYPTWAGVVFFLTIGPHLTGYMQLASVNYFALLTGLCFRKINRNIHALLMSAGILSDLALVLILQVKREAVQTAISFSLSTWNQAHIITSSMATLLYIPILVIGISLWRRTNPERYAKRLRLHRQMGTLTLIFRTLGFVLMFSMLKSAD